MPGLPAAMTAETVDASPSTWSSSSLDDLLFPKLSRRAIDACAFASWFPRFKRVTPKATVIPLDATFLEYLRADGVFLPSSEDSDDSQDSEFDPNGDTDEEDEEVARPKYDFSELSARIQGVIDDYGAVFPKLNWSSPQDAAWMVAGPPLKCMNPEDVYLLLKSSDFITHDLDHAYEDCEEEEEATGDAPTQYHLVLKKWFEMPRSHEFRCFVKEGSLIAIAQRDTNFYDFLQERSRQTIFTDAISRFFADKIQSIFPEPDYIFDVYMTRDESKVFLIDFNPYAPRTDSLLYSWDELHGLGTEGQDKPSFRVVESETEASQSMPSFSHNRYPKEVVGLSDGASIADFAQKWRDELEEAGAPEAKPSASTEPVGR